MNTIDYKVERRNKRMKFRNEAIKLMNTKTRVRIITTNGTFDGRILSVGSDFLRMRVKIDGTFVNMFIRLVEIVALFSILGII
jgi:hypothetical protein